MAAESKRVRNRDLHRHLARLIGHVIEIALRILIDEIDRRRCDLFVQGKRGKHGLDTARRAEQIRDVAIVRVEQLYPFPTQAYEAIIRKYAKATEVVWCQEEPQNQGAWYSIRHRLEAALAEREIPLLYAGRGHAAAPATGISKVHETEQAGLVAAALRATVRRNAGNSTERLVTDTAAPAPKRKSS